MIRFASLFLFIFSCYTSDGQTNSRSVKVYWDVSLSMQQRDLEKEVAFLEDYIKENEVRYVNLILFSDKIKQTKDFRSVNGNWSNLATFLSELRYDGISDFDFLLAEDSTVPSLLFTDGYPRLKELKLHYGKSKMDIICATGSCNAKLERLSLYSIGIYHALLPERTNTSIIDNEHRSEQKAITVRGMVSNENGPLQDVAIILKDSGKGTLTLGDGSFAIKATDGDSLIFQFLGKRTVMLLIGQNSNFLDVVLEDAPESLDEVVVVQKEKIQWLPKEKVLGYGGMQTIGKKDITVSSGSLNESLVGKISGLQTNKDGLSMSIIRGFSSITYSNYPLIIIDGAPMPRPDFKGQRDVSTDVMNIVNPNDVVSVKVLKGLAAANRYGGEGANGVILIQTIYGNVKLSEQKDNKTTNSALLRDNIFTGELKIASQDLDKPYLQAIKAQSTVKESYRIYLEERDAYSTDPYYFINVHNFFQKSDSELAEDILNSALAVAGTDIAALRTIAFYHEKAERYKQASAIYQQIVKLDSSRIQGYRDLANVNIQAGNTKEGLKSYLELLKPDFQPELSPKSVKDIVTIELKNLIYRKGKELDVSKVVSAYKTAPRYDARVLLEWNNSETEFEVEFISPFKRISKWSHTIKDNQERIQNELRYGFQIEESLLSQVQKGTWYLNVRTIGVKEGAPLYLKCTVYYYYGQAGQYTTQEVFAFNSGSNESLVTKILIR